MEGLMWGRGRIHVGRVRIQAITGKMRLSASILPVADAGVQKP
jgi:hypothetical protein